MGVTTARERLRARGSPERLLARAVRLLAAEPPRVGRWSGEAVFLSAAIVLQWLALVGLVVSARHNGWLFYQGGDQTFFYTIAWIVAHGHLPVTGIGYAWSLVEAPVAAVAGPSFLHALPGIVAVQVLLLLPLGLVAFYALVKRLLGPFMARVGALAWVVAPYAAIPLFVDRYHARWVDQTIPQLVGLTGMGDFATLVILTAAAYFVFRHLDDGDWESAALAGLLAGLAVGVKPSTGLFLAGPAAAFLLARRLPGAAAFAAGLAPALLTLALWKQRGLGYQPLFATEAPVRAAVGSGLAPELVGATGIRRYVDFDWGNLGHNLDLIREYFWSNRLVEWLPLAGAVGALRRSPPKAVLLAVWLAAYVVVKGTNRVSSVDTASFWRLLAPAWPAYLLLALSIVALVPTVGPLVTGAAATPAGGGRPRSLRRPLVAAAIVLGLVPLAIVVALPRDTEHRGVRDGSRNLYVAVDPAFRPATTVRGGQVTLTWTGPSSGSVRPTYIVWRSRARFAGDDAVDCDSAPVPSCTVRGDELGYTSPPFVDRPGPGRWVYRVAQAADYTGDAGSGDPLVYSQAVTATVR